MQTNRRELRDWFIITVIILIGFLCLIIAGSMAIRFSPSWKLAANMDSRLDPNSDFLTRRPQGFIEPVDESILTPAIWVGLFQTPGASVPQRTPLPTLTNAPVPTSTTVPVRPNPATATLIPTNTIIYYPPASPTNTSKPRPIATATTTATATATAPVPVDADLQITKDDGVLMYAAGTTLTYTIIVNNKGSTSVMGAVITDTIPAQIDNWVWVCTAQNGGATGCDPAASNKLNFSDTIDLPTGASIKYTVTANISTAASGDLINAAAISAPTGITESDLTNNVFSDTDQFLASSPLPVGNIGTTPDGIPDTVMSGSSVTFSLSGFLLDGNFFRDTVYYEKEETSSSGKIHLGNVQIEVYDQTTAAWYMIYNWGDEIVDTNASYNNGNSEPDGFPVDKNLLYGVPPLNTGIAIDIDTPAIAQGGAVGDLITLIRIKSLSNTNCEVDSVQMLR
jgi:uncharacterized repeat protein (TIGR01451 family)